MKEFEQSLNKMLVETFEKIVNFEQTSMRDALGADVTLAEVHLIEALGTQPNKQATVGRLAQVLNVSAPTVTVAVKRLVAKDCVEKLPCRLDGRQVIVRLTEEGKRIERTHRILHKLMIREVCREFAPDERVVLLRLLDTLNRFFA